MSAKNLEFMQRQSSRADITPWSFENEYHFGDFRGDAAEMLRRGYDFHLHYANFGIRKLMIRFPNGLPNDFASLPYFDEEGMDFLEDKQGSGGILSINPYLEAGQLDDLWEPGGFVERLLSLRAEILDGDLRPLYLAHLAIVSDGNLDPIEHSDDPVPAGVNKLTAAQQELAEFYGLSDVLIEAAARNSPTLPEKTDKSRSYTQWIQKQPEARKNEWLSEWMADSHAKARSEILAEYEKSRPASSWPRINLNRTIAQLNEAAEEIDNEKKTRNAEKGARRRAKELADMAANPHEILEQTNELAKGKGREIYRRIAALLANLREALINTDQPDVAERQARKLRDQHPTSRVLTAEFRAKGFLKR